MKIGGIVRDIPKGNENRNSWIDLSQKVPGPPDWLPVTFDTALEARNCRQAMAYRNFTASLRGLTVYLQKEASNG